MAKTSPPKDADTNPPTIDDDTAELSPPSTPKPGADKRPLMKRLFGIGLWGAFKLVLLCILVGFVVMAVNFDPASGDTSVLTAMGEVARQLMAAAGWAIRNFWKPALAGAVIVLPLWVLWRLVSLPFRK